MTNVVSAQDLAEKFARVQAAINAVLPEKDFSIWERTEGDINGDEVQDWAAVVVHQPNVGSREERLVVFAGTSDGHYEPLSVSGGFCEPRKFYNLTIRKNSLFVQAVENADATSASSFTLQFRYNAKLKDLELVGEETLNENYEDGSYYRVSTNYLTKTVIHTRQSGKKKKEVVSRLNNAPAILRLQGFDCSAHGSADSIVYIDENFGVQEK
jgi:hypothetical protein